MAVMTEERPVAGREAWGRSENSGLEDVGDLPPLRGWDEICDWGRKHALKYGLTDDVINEELRRHKEERKRGDA